MKHVYVMEETPEVSKILDETYYDVFAALKRKNPKTKVLADDDEYSKLHDILAMLRLGHIDLDYAESSQGRVIFLEIK